MRFKEVQGVRFLEIGYGVVAFFKESDPLK